MNHHRTLTTTTIATLAALLLIACAGDDSVSQDPDFNIPKNRRCTGESECALANSAESMTCTSGPWTYGYERNGMSLATHCGIAKGQSAPPWYYDLGIKPAIAPLLERQYISAGDDQQYVLDLHDGEDATEWPSAMCDLRFAVTDDYTVPGTVTVVIARITTHHETSDAWLTANNKIVQPFRFEGCEYSGVQPL